MFPAPRRVSGWKVGKPRRGFRRRRGRRRRGGGITRSQRPHPPTACALATDQGTRGAASLPFAQDPKLQLGNALAKRIQSREDLPQKSPLTIPEKAFDAPGFALQTLAPFFAPCHSALCPALFLKKLRRLSPANSSSSTSFRS